MVITSEMIKNIRQLERMKEELEAELEAAKDEIKAMMTAENCYEYSGDDFKVTWNERTTSRLDTKAIKAALPDVCEKYTVTSTTRYFKVA